jgi:hypothetical protein
VVALTAPPFSVGVVGSHIVGDAGPPLRDAALAAEEAGGGTLFLPPGVYRFDSFDPTPVTADEYALVALGDNVSVEAPFGAVTIILTSGLADDAPGRLSFLATKPGTGRQRVRNLVFDADEFVLTEAFQSYNIVRANSDDVLCENLYGKNLPGRNTVVVSGDRATVRNVQIVNGSQNVPGNTVADDASMIYLSGDDHLVERCRLVNETAAVIACGGIEAHGSNITVRKNKLTNLFPAVYTGYQNGTDIAYNQEITGNEIVGCRGGVVFIDRHVGGSTHHNQFRDGVGAPDILTPRDDTTGVTSAGVIDGHNIHDNDHRAGTHPVAVRLAGYQNARISDTFKGYKEPVVLLSSTTPISSVSVSRNTVADPPGDNGVSQGLVHIAADGDTWGGTISDVQVVDNTAVKSGAAAANTSVLLVSGDPAHTTLARIKAARNRAVGVSDAAVFFGAFQSSVEYVAA